MISLLAAGVLLAAQDQGLQIVAACVPVRTGPDAAYAELGAVTGGQIYVSTLRSNGYHKIWFNRSEGWVHGAAVAPASLTYDAVTSGTNVRSGPTTSAGEVGYAVKGSKWAVIGTSAGWHRIFYEGREAWFSASGRSTSFTYTDSAGEPSLFAEEAVEISASIPVRSGPGLAYAEIGTAGPGQAYVSTETRSHWRKIGWSREEGWIPAYAAVLRSAAIDRVTNAWLNVRTGPATSFAAIDSVPAGSRWAAVAFSGSWHRIWFAGQPAWISGTMVSTSDFGAPPAASSAGFVKLPASGPGFVRRCGANNPDHAWGTPELVNGLIAAAEAWAAARPDYPAVRVGDLSLPQGGVFEGHVTHRGGLDADLFLLRSDASSDGALDVYDPAYSSARTREWIVDFLVPAFPASSFLLCDPALFGCLTTVDSVQVCAGQGCPLDASGAHVAPSAAGLPYVRCNPGHDDHVHVNAR
jgi:uncharacterized protein YgiM (DUF1202 family)